MDSLTLTQYISTRYHSIILKLDGLNNFQKVHGFICGLNNEYNAKVKTQYPKTLEEAIKSAQIFDDISDKKALALSHNKSSASSFSSFKNKRKNANFSKE